MFVTIETEDVALSKMLDQVNKYCHMQVWLGKATSLLKTYSATLNQLDSEKGLNCKRAAD